MVDTAAALAQYDPLVVCVQTSTPQTVSVERVLELLAQDEEAAGVLHVVDTSELVREPSRAAGSKGGKAERGKHGAAAAGEEAALTPAEAVRAELVRIAVSREEERQRAAAERRARVEALAAQYVEDGFDEAAAAAAAEQEVREEEEEDARAAAEDAGEGGGEGGEGGAAARAVFYLCVTGPFPSTLEDLELMRRAGVGVRVLVDLRSRVPLSGSAAALAPGVADARQAEGAARPAPKKGGKAAEEAPLSLPESVQQRQATRRFQERGAADEVLLLPYEFPAVASATKRNADGSALYFLDGSERALVSRLGERLAAAEQQYALYRTWAEGRRAVEVPAFAALVDPEVSKYRAALAEQEAEQLAAKKKHSVAGKKQSVSELPPPPPEPPAPTTAEDLAVPMDAFAAHKRAAERAGAALTARRVLEGCVLQAVAGPAGTDPALPPSPDGAGEAAAAPGVLPSAEEVAERQMRSDAEDVLHALSGALGPLLARGAVAGPGSADSSVSSFGLSREEEAAADGGATAAEADALVLLEELRRLAASDAVPVDAEGDALSQLARCGVVRLGRGGRGCAAPQPFLQELLRAKNMGGWSLVAETVGEGGAAATVSLLHREKPEEGRTLSSVYSFEGATTFPEFVAALERCAREELYFHPPPPDSDAEPSSEEEEEEEEPTDEEDEEGNVIPRRPKVPPPVPFRDHVGAVQSALRRGRVHRFVSQYVGRGRLQEACGHGGGARAAVEETQYMFPSDGCTIEVERAVGNTRQVRCEVAPVRGVHCGFAYVEPRDAGAAAAELPVVSSDVRAFAELPGLVVLSAEVAADNRAAAEQRAYERAVAAARAEAQALFDAQGARGKGKAKDKSGQPVRTLEEWQAVCVSAVPAPPRREVVPPLAEVHARVLPGGCCGEEAAVRFRPDAAEAVCRFARAQPLCAAGGCACVLRWADGRVGCLRVTRVSGVAASAGGTLEVFAPELSAERARLLLSPRGDYWCVSADGARVLVTASGKVVVQEGGGAPARVERRLAVSCSAALGGGRTRTREDGLVVTEAGGGGGSGSGGTRPRRVRFWCAALECDCAEPAEGGGSAAAAEWRVGPLPAVVCGGAARGTVSLLGADGCFAVEYDWAARAVRLGARGERFGALLDLALYRLHVQPTSRGTGSYTVDCAYGGLVGELGLNQETAAVYRVSPLGRCSLERGGALVLPGEYRYAEPQPLMRLREMLSPAFCALRDTDMVFERDALHMAEAYRHTGAVAPAVSWPWEGAGGSAVEASYELKAKAGIAAILRAAPARSWAGVELCAFVHTPRAEVAFLSPELLRRLVVQLQARAVPLLSRPCAVGPELQVLCVRAEPGEGGDAAVTADASEPALEWYAVVSLADPAAATVGAVRELAEPARLAGCVGEASASLRARLPLSKKLLAATPAAAGEAEAARRAEVAREARGGKPTAAAGGSAAAGAVAGAPAEEDAQEPLRPRFWATRAAPLEVRPYALPEPPADAEAEKLARRRQERQERLARVAAAPPSGRAAGGSSPAPSVAEPLMRSRAMHEEHFFGTTASTRNHCPDLAVAPAAVRMGRLLPGRRYAALLHVTNTSTVPCRYRFTVPAEAKAALRVEYPRHFIAPGMTELAEVAVTGGGAPAEETSVTVLLSYEGGSMPVPVSWSVGDGAGAEALERGVTCVGDAPVAFQPGTTHRARRRGEGDGGEDAAISSSSGSDGEGELSASSVVC